MKDILLAITVIAIVIFVLMSMEIQAWFLKDITRKIEPKKFIGILIALLALVLIIVNRYLL